LEEGKTHYLDTIALGTQYLREEIQEKKLPEIPRWQLEGRCRKSAS
jgi:hypothetical protein